MSLSILNNVSSLLAENALAQASAGQQKALQQLSTGLRINSSADDAAGLSIANGLQANIDALTQSVSNANNGIGFLQIADGALSQVTGLLNRAVTLATEAASSGLTGQQRGAADTEYQSILTEINQIGTTTEFNSTQVFTDGNNSSVVLANNGSTLTGTINPLDTLSGGLTVTSTVPGLGGTTKAITASTSGTTTTATITPGAALSGSLTINSSKAEIDGVGEPLSFTASADGSTITSSPINAGYALSGMLEISSSGGNAPRCSRFQPWLFPGAGQQRPGRRDRSSRILGKRYDVIPKRDNRLDLHRVSSLSQKNRRTRSSIRTGIPSHGRSLNLRL